MPRHGHQSILDVHLKVRRIGLRFPVGIQSRFSVVDQDSVERQQYKMGKQFLLHATLCLSMKIINANQFLGDLIQLLYTPASMIEGRKG